MQTHGGAEAEAAILSAERQLIAEIKVDWLWNGLYNHAYSNLSAYADNIVVDRSLTGAAPSEIMLIEGSSAAELSFVVGGEDIPSGRNFVGLFSPYNGVSPFYNLRTVGAEVTYRIGVQTVIGVIWYSQFVGNIRKITPNRGSNSVTISALDRVEKLRVPISQTDWGMLDLQANQGYISGQLMNSQWVIDHCLRFGKTSPSPYRWWTTEEKSSSPSIGTRFWLTGNGGIAPNIGWVDGSYQNQFPNTDFNPALTMYQDYGQVHPNSPDPSIKPQMLRAQRNWGQDFNVFWVDDRLESIGKLNFQIHFTLHTQNLAGSDWWATMPDSAIFEFCAKDDRFITVMVGAGQMWLRYRDDSDSFTFNGTKVNIPSGVGNEYVRCSALLKNIGRAPFASFQEQIQLRVGATTTALQSMRATQGWFMSSTTGRIRLWRKLALQDISITTRNPDDPLTAIPAAEHVAVLDHGLNKLSFLPNRRGALAWDVITEVAAAEFGAVFWDENGVFKFWNQNTVSSKKTNIVRTLTLDHVGGLEITSSLDSVRNIFAITAKKSRVQNVIVYSTTGPDEIVLLPGQYTEIRVWIDNIVTPNSGSPTVYQTPESNGGLPVWNDTTVRFGVVPQVWNGTTWQDVLVGGGTWEGQMYRSQDGGCTLLLWNGLAEMARFALSGGSPAFRWDGSQLTSFDDQVFQLTDSESVEKWGAQGLELSGDWYQEFYANGPFLSTLLARTSEPIPTTQTITIAGDPRLQLGDAIRVVDPEGLGEDMQLQIYGIRRSFSRDQGLVDELAVEMTRPPQIGIWDSAQYGLWNQTFFWSA